METALTQTKIMEVIQQHRIRPAETVEVEWGYTFTVFNDVFSPFIAPSGQLGLSFASLPIFRGKRVLDMGCGSGIIACMMALNGASNVVGIDINPSAIRNAERNSFNLQLNNKVEFRHGNLFEPIRKLEEFDIVYADLPFTDGQPSDPLEAAFFDPHLASIRSLLENLNKVRGLQNAKLYLASSSADGKDLQSVATSNRLSWRDYIFLRLPWIDLQIAELRRIGE